MKIRRLKYACYTTSATMSVVANLSPLLFITFHNRYGISYTLLGMLVLINFVTQLLVDLAFSFFSHRFNIKLTVKLTPVIAAVGLLAYSLAPLITPSNVYLGLVIGTLIFSSASGLAEVLISPVIAAIPSDEPDREMSKLHSVYAWGVVFVIIVSTLFLLAFGDEKWQFLPILFTFIPILSTILFLGVKIPDMQTNERVSGVISALKNKSLWLCVAAIFLGGAAEVVMAQWSSGYLEQALGIEKVWGDIFGVAMFGVTLGLGRSLYGKFGKNVTRVLLLGAIGASACYLVAALSSIRVAVLIAIALTGLCVSMMWPGSLVVAQEYFPKGGVFIFAMMAAGGDLGASIGPQLVGIITDSVAGSEALITIAETLMLSPEQLGMKIGMLFGAFFPLIAIFVYLYIHKSIKKGTV